jgi:hypothetical protein
MLERGEVCELEHPFCTSCISVTASGVVAAAGFYSSSEDAQTIDLSTTRVAVSQGITTVITITSGDVEIGIMCDLHEFSAGRSTSWGRLTVSEISPVTSVSYSGTILDWMGVLFVEAWDGRTLRLLFSGPATRRSYSNCLNSPPPECIGGALSVSKSMGSITGGRIDLALDPRLGTFP